jgi:hypothetical protein
LLDLERAAEKQGEALCVKRKCHTKVIAFAGIAAVYASTLVIVKPHTVNVEMQIHEFIDGPGNVPNSHGRHMPHMNDDHGQRSP